MQVRRLRKGKRSFTYAVTMDALERQALAGMGSSGKVRRGKGRSEIPDGRVCGAIEMILDEAAADGVPGKE